MTAASRAWHLALLAPAVALVGACGGGGSKSVSSGSPPPSGANVAPLVVDGGVIVNGQPQGTINQAYVTVTVCVPGTATCQAIDHVWVDTGSYGLRLVQSAFTAQLPTSKDTSGNVIGNCVQFVNTYAWGAVRTADVKIAGESASSVPIQVISDPAVPATAPTSCSVGTAATFGGNGLIGIGTFRQDCGGNCTDPKTGLPAPGFYYTCPGNLTANCASIAMANTQQLQNVVGLFSTDNNGSLIQLQAVPSGGAATATGSLIFGINTQSNNALGSAAVFAADPSTGFIATSTTYGDMQEPASYIDSGSNGFFFNDTITQCTGASAGFYCPSTPVTLQATMLPYNNTVDPTKFTYGFTISDVFSINTTNAAFNNVGGSAGTCSNATGSANPCSFDWGLPFFYGRSVFTALEQAGTINGHLSPFVAATTP